MSRNVTVPTYKEGFATCAAVAEYPGLWTGLEASLPPSLGPTGLTLHDASGRRNDGILTNMDPETDWVPDPVMGWALAFDGNDDEVIIPQAACPSGGQVRTVNCWLLYADPTTEKTLVSWGVSAAGARWEWAILSNELSLRVHGGRRQWTRPAITADQWHLATVVLPVSGGKVSDLIGYFDGVELPVLATNDEAINTTATAGTIGGRIQDAFHFPGQFGQVAIWSRALALPEIKLLHAHPGAIHELRDEVFAPFLGAPPTGQPTMRRWGGVPHMMLGPVLAGRTW